MKTNPDLDLADEVSKYYADPLGFVMFAYPWDEDESLKIVKLPEKYRERFPKCEYGPDEWACEQLDKIGDAVREHGFNGKEAVEAIRMAIASGHGIGKSCLVAWLVDWIMSTRAFCHGTVTANTIAQLQTKTWAQIAKWTKLCATSHWFDVSTGRGNLFIKHKEYPDDWFCSGQTCKEENSEAFAGQHAVNSTSFYIFDEASKIPNIIKEVAEGGTTDGEPMIFAFGNPTNNSGWFYDCFHKQRHRWITRRIDSRSVQITNKKQIQQWIDDYGEDSDFVKVRVKGEFPSQSINQLISRDLAELAARRKIGYHQFNFAATVMGVDCAGTGEDDWCVFLRQGLASQMLGRWKIIDDMLLGSMLNQWWEEYNVDACFIDPAYGSGVISYLRNVNRNPIPVPFGGKSMNPIFKNRRTEIWWKAKEWLKDGGVIPNDQQLIDDLCAPDIFMIPSGQWLLESKDDMKARGLPSPSTSDSLCLTFSENVSKQNKSDDQIMAERNISSKPRIAVMDYNPITLKRR